jgi:hypothetical protein
MNKLFLIVFLLLCSCVTVTTVNVGQKTSLEYQLMGDFEPLTEEQILTSSVRSSLEENAYQSEDKAHEKAVFARKRQMYNRDEIKEYKSHGCLYEKYPALLQEKPCDFVNTEDKKKKINAMIEEENQDRNHIMAWIKNSNKENLDQQKIDILVLYHAFLFQESSKGDWFLEKNGSWIQK